MIGITEIVFILIGGAIFFFGGRKIVEFARSLGRFTGEFKKGKMEIEKELEEAKNEIKEIKEIKD